MSRNVSTQEQTIKNNTIKCIMAFFNENKKERKTPKLLSGSFTENSVYLRHAF